MWPKTTKLTQKCDKSANSRANTAVKVRDMQQTIEGLHAKNPSRLCQKVAIFRMKVHKSSNFFRWCKNESSNMKAFLRYTGRKYC